MIDSGIYLNERQSWHDYLHCAMAIVKRSITDSELTEIRRGFKGGASAESVAATLLTPKYNEGRSELPPTFINGDGGGFQ